MSVQFGTEASEKFNVVDQNTVIYAGGGEDTVLSTASDARVFGEDGNDFIELKSSVGRNLVFADGGNGNDTIYADYGVQGSFRGGSGDDHITAYGGGSDIYGESGNDRIWTFGSKFIDGGTGDDNIYEISSINITIIGGDGNDTIGSGGSGSAYFYGGNGNDLIYGATIAYGGSGNDTISGMTLGGNSAFGGDGDDNITGSNSETVDGGNGNDTIYSGLSTLTYGGDGDDVIYGDAYIVNGGDGNDLIYTDGLYGASVDGGAGSDTIVGASFNFYETFDGSGVFEAGSADMVDYSQEKSGIRIDLRSSGLQSIASGQDKLVDVYNINGTSFADDLAGSVGRNILFGNDGDDRIRGFGGSDILYGGGGNDIIDGGDDGDTMEGGLGNDTYVVSDLRDVVVEEAGFGTDTVKVSLAEYALGGNLETLQFVGGGSFVGIGNSLANSLFGGAGDDRLTGLAGADRLTGAAGNDTLIGGADRDDLTGGAGSDAFVFGKSDFGSLTKADVIKDFSHAQGDYIDLSLIPGLAFIGTGAFSRSAGEVRYEGKGPDTYVYGDVNGDGTADFAIQLSGSIALDASDLHL